LFVFECCCPRFDFCASNAKESEWESSIRIVEIAKEQEGMDWRNRKKKKNEEWKGSKDEKEIDPTEERRKWEWWV